MAYLHYALLLMMGRGKDNSSIAKEAIKKWQDDPSDTNLADLLSGAATKPLIKENLKPDTNGTLKPTNEKVLKSKGQKRKKSKLVAKKSEDKEGLAEHTEDNEGQTEHPVDDDDDGGLRMVAESINGSLVYVARLEETPLNSDEETSSDESDDFILQATIYQNGSRTEWV